MAKPSNTHAAKPAENAKAEAPATENANEAAPVEKEEPELTPEQKAEVVARKQAAGTLGKAWKAKGGTDIPQRFDGAEFSQYEAKMGATLEETVQNMLAFVDGANDLEKIQAVLDKFNGAHRLEAQKHGKDLMKDASTDVASVQDLLNVHLSGSKRRGTGKPRTEGKLKKAQETAKAAAGTANEMLEELRAINPEAAAKYEERLKALGQLS